MERHRLGANGGGEIERPTDACDRGTPNLLVVAADVMVVKGSMNRIGDVEITGQGTQAGQLGDGQLIKRIVVVERDALKPILTDNALDGRDDALTGQVHRPPQEPRQDTH